MSESRSTESHTSTAQIVVAWAIVGIPLFWGLALVALKAVALFK